MAHPAPLATLRPAASPRLAAERSVTAALERLAGAVAVVAMRMGGPGVAPLRRR